MATGINGLTNQKSKTCTDYVTAAVTVSSTKRVDLQVSIVYTTPFLIKCVSTIP